MQAFLTQLADKTKENTEQTKKLAENVSVISKTISGIDKRQEKQDKKVDITNKFLESLVKNGELERRNNLKRDRLKRQLSQRRKADTPVSKLKEKLSGDELKGKDKKGGLLGGLLGLLGNGLLGILGKGLGGIGPIIARALANIGPIIAGAIASALPLALAAAKFVLPAAAVAGITLALTKAVRSGLENFDKFVGGVGETKDGDKFIMTDIAALKAKQMEFERKMMKEQGQITLDDAATERLEKFDKVMSAMKVAKRANDDIYEAKQLNKMDQKTIETSLIDRDIQQAKRNIKARNKAIEELENEKLFAQKQTTKHYTDLQTTKQDLYRVQIKAGRRAMSQVPEEMREEFEKLNISPNLIDQTFSSYGSAEEVGHQLYGLKKVSPEEQRIQEANDGVVLHQKGGPIKLQSGGPIAVPGSGSGDKVPMMLPTGSFVLNRNASQHLQQGGPAMVPTVLEPGETIHPPGTWEKQGIEKLNKDQPRFGNVNRSSNGAPSENNVKPQGYQKGGKIFLHWAGSGYSGAHPAYHATVQGDGSVVNTRNYDDKGGGHTHLRNDQGIGISLAAMAGANDKNFGAYPVKQEQYDGMAKLIAQIAQSRGWNASDINVNNVLTHAEAASGKDGQLPGNDNYGPQPWGGDGSRWDLWKLFEGDKNGSGGDKIRSMVKSYMEYKDFDENVKYKTGDIVKKDGQNKIFDGFGWAEYTPGSVTSQGTIKDTLNSTLSTPVSPNSTTDSTTDTPTGLMGMFSALGDLGILGADFMEGMAEGWEKGWRSQAVEGTNAYNLQKRIGDGLGGMNSILNFLGLGSKGSSGDSKGSSGDSKGSSGDSKGTTSSEPLSGDIHQTAKMMHDYIVSEHKLSSNQAKGIVANIHRESTFDPKVRSGDDQGPGGLFQWKGSRQTPEVASLVDSGNWKGQIDYALKEDAGPRYKDETAGMNAQQSADWWMKHWERPADEVAGSKKHTQFLEGYKFQQGGMVPTLLEPGEKVFMPGQWDSSIESLNSSVPRFQSGGVVNLGGQSNNESLRSANAARMEQQVATFVTQPIIMPMQGGGGGSGVSVSTGEQNSIPHLSDTPSSSFAANLVMTRNILSENIGG